MTPTRRISVRKWLAVAAIGVLILVARQTASAHPDDGCNNCHVPHNSNSDTAVPLWNPAYVTTTLTGNYSSPTLNATPGEPDGSSKLCLSCHDGTYAGLDAQHTINSLSTDHPISFVFDTALATADGALVDPTTLAPGILDRNNKVQCTSCHDVHATAAQEPDLRWAYNDTSDTAFCRHCHLK